jgi:hypothetical protein
LVASSNYPLAVESYLYTLVEAPEGMTLLNDELTWVPTFEQFGTHSVKVSVLPKDAPSALQPVVGEFNINVQGMTIDRVEVRAESRRLETISRANYLGSSTPYVIDREAKLGDTIELKISIRNNLPSSADNELRDVEIEINSFDLVNADGQEAFISRIRAGRTEDQTISFFIDPLDVHPDDAPFDLEIRVSGETRNGDYFSDVWVLELRLESNSYDLLMINPTVNPESICPDQRLRVSLDLRNIGTRDLSAAGIRYYVPGLDINEWDRNLRIDYDETRSMIKFLDVPADAVPGEYFLEVTAYPRMSSSSDTRTETFLITVRNCAPTTPTTPNITDPIIVTPPTQDIVVPGTPIADAVGTTSKSIFDKDNKLYVVLLTALVVLLFIGVILLLVSVFKK